MQIVPLGGIKYQSLSFGEKEESIINLSSAELGPESGNG